MNLITLNIQNMATLIIKRTSEYSYKLRDYKIYLDDALIGTIEDGQTKVFEINSGQHAIYAGIDKVIFSPTLSFLSVSDEKNTFQIGSSKYGKFKQPKLIFFGLIGLLIFSLICKLILSLDYPHLLFILIFAVLIYFLMLGRSSYLTINEVVFEG